MNFTSLNARRPLCLAISNNSIQKSQVKKLTGMKTITSCLFQGLQFDVNKEISILS